MSLDGQRLPPAVRLALTPGARLRIRAGADGAWCYLAVGGRIDVPPMLGSNATHTRSSLGGIDGRALTAGDVLPVRDVTPCEAGASALTAPWLERSDDPIRVILGPQDDYFSHAQIETFCREPWTISNRSDRMAYFLDGASIAPENGLNIVSDGIVMGAIQVLGDGRPMVLMADRQVTGGYPEDRDRDRAGSGTAGAAAAGLVGAVCGDDDRSRGGGAARRARDVGGAD